MKIAVDVRRIRDFGVGTYIRNLLNALSQVSDGHDYNLICCGEDKPRFAELPDNFRTVIYNRRDSSRLDHLDLPRLLHKIGADLTHIPFHRVPFLMPKPYLVTIHDLGSLFFDEAAGLLHAAREYRLKRGLLRADRIIAVSGATQRDVANLVPDVGSRIRLIYNAPDPQFLEHGLPSDARAADPTQPRASGREFLSATRFAIRSCFTPVPSARRRTFPGSSKPLRWRAVRLKIFLLIRICGSSSSVTRFRGTPTCAVP